MITVAQLLKPVASTLDHPLEHLIACHRRIEDRLATLERVALSLESRPAEALEAMANALRFLDATGVIHASDEEDSLFPRLRSEASAKEAPFLTSLESDHDQAEAIYARLKRAAAELGHQDAAVLTYQFTELVADLCAVYRRHIREEDTLLVPMARRLLSEADLAEIAAEMQRRRRRGSEAAV